ncbi:MAG: hypothetical protein FVQ82_03985 [Planctomycetes bacterium]|nr:hypothetical protein [Planctomycetota bacterium]
MSGSQSTAKKSNAAGLVHSDQFKKTLVCISVGIFSGLFIACIKLNLGWSGHKAFMWMTPLLIARFRTGAKIGTSAGGMFAAMTAYSLGANLAGGLIGFPLIAVAGGVLDVVANYIEKNKVSLFSMILLLAVAGGLANLICLVKRMFLPAGISPHNLFGADGMMSRALLYLFFGSLSGIVAAVIVKAVSRLKGDSKE